MEQNFKQLIMSNIKIDYILKGATVYQTFLKQFEKLDIAVSGETIYAVSPFLNYWDTTVIDCSGKYIVPGLIDIHMHVESSMTYPEEFSRIVLPYGVTTVVADPHEIANVFGIEGIETFLNQETQMDIFYGIPSSVPATNFSMETSGGTIKEQEVEKLLTNERVVCLGEVMNYKDLSSQEDTLIKRIIKLCKAKRGIRIEGHCPKLTGDDCQRFIFSGVDSDHTQQTPESILEKIRLGMFIELQEKSLNKETIEIIDKYNLYEYIALITDDTMPDHLMKGQLNKIVERAIELGMPLEMAIYCSTYTPARRMHLDDRGVIAPGKLADFAIYDSLEGLTPVAVYKNGKPVDMNAGFKKEVKFPDRFYKSVNCHKAAPSEFVLTTDIKDSVVAHVIKTAQFGNSTTHEVMSIGVRDKKVCWEEAGLCLAAVFNRYDKDAPPAFGLIDCNMKKSGAVATTWAHDSHNILVIGNSIEDMAIAQNELVDIQGGYVVVEDRKITACANLKIGGIVSDEPVEDLASALEKVRREIESMGYVNNNVIMSISTLTLLVSPELKLSDKGLFDVKTQAMIPLLEEGVKYE